MPPRIMLLVVTLLLTCTWLSACTQSTATRTPRLPSAGPFTDQDCLALKTQIAKEQDQLPITREEIDSFCGVDTSKLKNVMEYGDIYSLTHVYRLNDRYYLHVTSSFRWTPKPGETYIPKDMVTEIEVLATPTSRWEREPNSAR